MRFACRDAGAARFVNEIERGDGDARPRCGLAPCWDRDELGEVRFAGWRSSSRSNRIGEDSRGSRYGVSLIGVGG
jgi:hypothetical protein